ncbi:MAG: UDP-N-acetylmuramate dehydrogenase [Desulfobacterales bacterium]
MDISPLATELAQLEHLEVSWDVPLAPYTAYRIGGPTAIWVAPQTEAAVGAALSVIDAAQAPLLVLGSGSNVLISDQGWPGVTLWLGAPLSGWQIDSREVRVCGGTLLNDLIRALVSRGLSGLEMLAGIPGTVGGALRMNAGAFGREICQVTRVVTGFDFQGRPVRLPREAIDFGYRRASELARVVITAAKMELIWDDSRKLQVRLQDVLALRAKKQPLAHPSCGSVFKRPPGYFAGALIQEAGLKGARIGDAVVSTRHAGFILNTGRATADDVYALIRRIEAEVLARFGVQLEREVQLVGDFGGGSTES